MIFQKGRHSVRPFFINKINKKQDIGYFIRNKKLNNKARHIK